jgi:hypothetical protein
MYKDIDEISSETLFGSKYQRRSHIDIWFKIVDSI